MRSYMIRVAVSGCNGKMGSLTAKTILSQSDMELVCGIDTASSMSELIIDGAAVAPLYNDLQEALEQCQPDCLVDFTVPSSVANNIKTALSMSVSCVVGTTGLSSSELVELGKLAKNKCALFVAPNFTIGAVLLAKFAALASEYFPDVEIIELHHNNKADAPSGTAINTAERIAAVRSQSGIVSTAPGAATELEQFRGARGARLGDVVIHSVRSDAYMASQEVLFGSAGQLLTLRHDSFDRNSYMPGVMLAIRSINKLEGLVVGLESLLDG
jgi:4-hydroxy-tetrahydrodipicolinate reductase